MIVGGAEFRVPATTLGNNETGCESARTYIREYLPAPVLPTGSPAENYASDVFTDCPASTSAMRASRLARATTMPGISASTTLTSGFSAMNCRARSRSLRTVTADSGIGQDINVSVISATYSVSLTDSTPQCSDRCGTCSVWTSARIYGVERRGAASDDCRTAREALTGNPIGLRVGRRRHCHSWGPQIIY